MKKYKKFWAVLLTLAMVLGMSMTTLAAPEDEAAATPTTVDVTVKDAVNADLTYVQVVEPDATTTTGWKFSTDKIAEIFRDAFNVTTNDAAINGLIAAVENVADGNNVISATNTSSQFAKALSDVAASSDVTRESFPTAAEGTTDRVLPVSKAGIYAIQGSETGFTYNNMAAFVSFGTVENDNYPELQGVTITAKKAEETIDKKVTVNDKHVVPVGTVLEYTITTTVPNVKTNITDRTFKIIDKLQGGEYFLTGTAVDPEKGEVTAVKSIMMGDRNLLAEGYDFDEGADSNGNPTFTIDLSNLIDAANTNAGKTIVVKYTAIVTSPDGTKNGAIKESGNVEGPKSEDVTVYSGEITLTKYAFEKENDENVADNEKLAGAKFKVYKLVENKKVWATFNADYVFTGWTNNEEAATVVETSSVESTKGTLVVKGLGLGKYYFKEVEAPKGYHINEEDAEAELKLAKDAEGKDIIPTATVTAETYMIDSTLSALPSTGGIGTTIFTIGGCAIMIAAAFLFFASRKKNDNK